MVTQKNNSTDLNWDIKKLKGRYEINAPNGMSDTDFIRAITGSFNRYNSGSRDYEAFPDVSSNEGNCNNVSTGALEGAGVPSEFIDQLDPSGANPGLGEPLPEMLEQEKKGS